MNGVRTNVYVDGFNLYYGALKGRGPGHKWLDLARLAQRLVPRNEICRIRYFTARVSARPDDLRLPERQQVYLRALQTLPGLTVHLGEFKVTHPWVPVYDPHLPPGMPITKVRVIKTEEKGSDVNLATYLMLDACRRDFDAALVITNDSDLREPVRLVSEELGIPVGVVNPQDASRRNFALTGSFARRIRPETVTECQFPPVLTDTNGRTIRRPDGW